MVALVKAADPAVLDQVFHLFLSIRPPDAVSQTFLGLFDFEMAAVETFEYLQSYAEKYDNLITLEKQPLTQAEIVLEGRV